MKRADLAGVIASRCGLKPAEAERVLDVALKAIVETVAKGESVRLQPYLHFQVQEVKAMRRRNPRTGETFEVPAGTRLKIVAGKRLADAMSQE